MQYRWLTLLAVAASFAAPQLNADPPTRVGRLNLLDGSVSFRAAGVDEWAVAEPNRTLTTGDKVWTDQNSKAEFHVGSTAVRVGAQTEFDFINLDDETLQGRLAQGTMTIHVRSLDDGQVYEIDTPNGAVSLGSVGEYRIDVNTDGTQTKVTVWSGGAEVTAAGSSFQVNAQQFATINGTDTPTYDLADVGPYDDWDNWVLTRDRREDTSPSAQYVGREMTGYEDLDQYGHWRSDPAYGNVWVPDNVGPGWAPYHAGHWVWVDPWGWTWVDSSPWGYAPFHYGRWAYVGGGWAWCPGSPPPPPSGGVVVVSAWRPVYSPALVVFAGGGGWGAGVAVGGGGGGAVAWVALGVGEPYHPGWAAGPGYVNQVNYVHNTTIVNNTTVINNTTGINNNTNITNYRNAGAPGAVTAMPQGAMAGGTLVSRGAVTVTPAQLRSAPPGGGSPPGVVPTQAAVTGGGAFSGRRAVVPPAALANRAVVAKQAPPPAPVPFAAQQKALAANGGRPLAPAQSEQIRSTLPPSARTPNGALVRSATTAPAGGGLKPARAGLVAATPVKTGAGGFVSHADAARQTTQFKAQVATRTTPAGGGALGGPKGGVAAPPTKVGAPLAEPSKVGTPGNGNTATGPKSNVPHPPERSVGGGGGAPATGTKVGGGAPPAGNGTVVGASKVPPAKAGVMKPAGSTGGTGSGSGSTKGGSKGPPKKPKPQQPPPPAEDKDKKLEHHER
jgi:hypothetical protein